MNALPSVDSFFLMGGTLTAYIIFRELDRAGSNVARWVAFFLHVHPRHVVTSVLYYVHRYLRLTVPYALIMAVIIAVLPHVAYSPAWVNYAYSAEVGH